VSLHDLPRGQGGKSVEIATPCEKVTRFDVVERKQLTLLWDRVAEAQGAGGA